LDLHAVGERPEVIILDLLLPDVDGLAVFRRLCATADTVSVPAIFIEGDENRLSRAVHVREPVGVCVLKKLTSAELVLNTHRIAAEVIAHLIGPHRSALAAHRL
jgi:DNA-binding response OmpR family regulator